MTINAISKEVEKIRKTYDETDPARLADAMDIVLLYEPMGDAKNACKGFYLCQSRKQVVTINSDLPDNLRRIILTHEIGHAVLHRRAAGIRAFHDFVLFDETSVYEYEANIFAADYLMPDDRVLALLNGDLSFFGAAGELGVPAELLDFKFRVLKRKGYKVVDPPLRANSDFLKNVH